MRMYLIQAEYQQQKTAFDYTEGNSMELVKIDDCAFGEMTYRHNWYKQDNMTWGDEKISLRVVAQAYKGQDILDVQREGYISFRNKREALVSSIIKAVVSYYNNLAVDDDLEPKEATSDTIVKLVTPKSILFSREGETIILCDCTWDEEEGIAASVRDENVIITSQDEVL